MQDISLIGSTVRRAAAGDEMACARLVDEHHAPMVRAAYVITGEAEAAREATQVAWTKAWNRLGTLKQPERVRPWLVAIATNEARQLVRGRNRRTVHEISAGVDDRPRGDPSAPIEVMDLKRAVRRLSLDDA